MHIGLSHRVFTSYNASQFFILYALNISINDSHLLAVSFCFVYLCVQWFHISFFLLSKCIKNKYEISIAPIHSIVLIRWAQVEKSDRILQELISRQNPIGVRVEKLLTDPMVKLRHFHMAKVVFEVCGFCGHSNHGESWYFYSRVFLIGASQSGEVSARVKFADNVVVTV